MNKSYDKMVGLILVLFVLPYTIFSGIRFLSNPYTTMVAYSHEEYESCTLPGIVMRNEIVIDEGIQENSYYSRDDGDFVGIGQEIVRVYNSSTEVETLQLIADLEREIDALNDASTLQNQHLLIDNIGNYINTLLANMYTNASKGDLSEFGDDKEELTSLINQRMAATGRESNFNVLVSQLESAKNSYSATLGSPIARTIAPQGGYFSSLADDLCTTLVADNRETMDFSDLVSLISRTENTVLSPVTARLVTDHNWYIAVLVPEEMLDSFQVGRKLEMDLGISRSVGGTVNSLRTEEGESVAFIRCNVISSEILNLRNVDVQIKFDGYSGLLVNNEALRYNDQNESGVYIVQGGTVQFRRIEIVYQNDIYMLCKNDATIVNGLTLYDEVIISGKGAYDGKVLSSW